MDLHNAFYELLRETVVPAESATEAVKIISARMSLDENETRSLYDALVKRSALQQAGANQQTVQRVRAAHETVWFSTQGLAGCEMTAR